MSVIDKPTALAIRFALARRAWSIRDFARAIGLSYRATCNLISGNSTSRPARIYSEIVLQQAIWTPLEEFSRRERRRDFFGGEEIEILSAPLLRELAFGLSLLIKTVKRKALRPNLIATLDQHFIDSTTQAKPHKPVTLGKQAMKLGPLASLS